MVEWILAGITAAYLIATIFISFSNSKSAKSTQKQVEEMMRQYNESNRALVTVTFELIRNGLMVLHIKNNGNRIAKNVKIVIDKKFIESIDDRKGKEQLALLSQSTFVVGIGQSWYCLLGSHIEIVKISQKLIHIDITYCDSTGNYEEPIDIKLDEYFWSLIYDSALVDIYGEIKKQTQSYENINKTLGKSVALEKEQTSNFQDGIENLAAMLEAMAKENEDA